MDWQWQSMPGGIISLVFCLTFGWYHTKIYEIFLFASVSAIRGIKRTSKRFILAFFVTVSASFCVVYVSPVFLEYGGGDCLVDSRKNGYHSDYLWGYAPVKWSHTVLCGIEAPIQDAGNQRYDVWVLGRPAPKPVPLPGEWQVSHTTVRTRLWNVRLYYFAATTLGLYHVRIGWRWDDLDDFFLFSVVPLKKLPYSWEKMLWYRTMC